MAQCLWCQKSVRLSVEVDLSAEQRASCLCPECLIDICPKPLGPNASDEEQESGKEQRRFPRFPVLSEIMLTFGESRNQVSSALIADLSDSGMRLRLPSSSSPSPEDDVKVGIVGETRFFQAEGIVQWKRGIEKEFSLSFVEIGIQLINIELTSRPQPQAE